MKSQKFTVQKQWRIDDKDLQHLPEEVPKLVNMTEESPELDVVIGAYVSKRHSWFRNLVRLPL